MSSMELATAEEERPTLLAIGNIAAASVAARFLRLVKVLAVARMLSPEAYGVSAALALILGYAQFLDLGSSWAAFRDLTSAIGRRQAVEAARAASWMGALKLAGALIVGVGALAASFWPGLSTPLRWGLVALPAIAVSTTLLAQALLQLQARSDVADLSRATTLAAASDLVLCVTLTWVGALPGLLVGTALSPCLPLAFAAGKRALARPRLVPPPVLRSYLKTGTPLAVLAFLDQGLLSLGQVLIMVFLSLRDLGVFNIALVVPEAIRTLGAAGGAVLGARLLRVYAASGGRLARIERHTLLPVQLYASALPLVIAPLWIGGSYLISRYYGSYVEALEPMWVLLLAMNFLVVTGGVTTFLFAIDRHQRNLLILTPALCFNVVVDIALIRAGWGIMAVAAGSLLTCLLYAFVVLWYVAGYFRRSLGWRLRFETGALLPGLYLALVISEVERLLSFRRSLPDAAAAIGLTTLLLVPLALRAVRLGKRIDAEEAA